MTGDVLSHSSNEAGMEWYDNMVHALHSLMRTLMHYDYSAA